MIDFTIIFLLVFIKCILYTPAWSGVNAMLHVFTTSLKNHVVLQNIIVSILLVVKVSLLVSFRKLLPYACIDEDHKNTPSLCTAVVYGMLPHNYIFKCAFLVPLSSSKSMSWSTIDMPLCSFSLVLLPLRTGVAGAIGSVSEGGVSWTILKENRFAHKYKYWDEHNYHHLIDMWHEPLTNWWGALKR